MTDVDDDIRGVLAGTKEGAYNMTRVSPRWFSAVAHSPDIGIDLRAERRCGSRINERLLVCDFVLLDTGELLVRIVVVDDPALAVFFEQCVLLLYPNPAP